MTAAYHLYSCQPFSIKVNIIDVDNLLLKIHLSHSAANKQKEG